MILTNRIPPVSMHARNKFKYQVKRILYDRKKSKFFPKEIVYDLLDTKNISKEINSFRPDVIYLAHISGLSRAILPYLANLQVPIIFDEGGTGLKGAWTERGRWYFFCGDYQSEWRIINNLKPLVMKLVVLLSNNRIQLKWHWPLNMRVFFNSHSNMENCLSFGVPVEKASVIHSGIDSAKFAYVPRNQINHPVRIVCPGRLEPRKGQLDAINLLSLLINQGIRSELMLVGEIRSNTMLEEMLVAINSKGLNEFVNISGMVSQEEMVKLYQQADICFFPSYHLTGFSRTPLEAMACGAVVISYGNEGSVEIIKHTTNGFLINAGCINEVAKIVEYLLKFPDELSRITTNARKDVEQKFALIDYIEKVEQFIQQSI